MVLHPVADAGRRKTSREPTGPGPEKAMPCAEYRVMLTNGGWQVTGLGSPAAPFKRKLAAVRRAKTLARDAQRGEVVIHGADGKIQSRHTYEKAARAWPIE